MQAFNRALLCVALCVVAIFSKFSLAVELPTVTIEHDVQVKMRDGVVLRADIYRPNAPGKFPIILTRTPYDKRGDVDFGLKGVARGYVVINQDVRGRYTSDGEWYPFLHESDDGYDTVEWAASLPYSDGRVGMYGGSYVGATQMLAAIAHPPASRRNLPGRHRQQLSRWMDVSRRRVRAVVQRIVDVRSGARHAEPVCSTADQCAERNLETSAYRISAVSFAAIFFQIRPAARSSLPTFSIGWRIPAYDDYWKRWTIEEHYRRHSRAVADRRRMV